MVTIYKIFDAGDRNYEPWYGDQDDIVEYLREHNWITDYNEKDGWVKNLERYGLTFKEVYSK